MLTLAHDSTVSLHFYRYKMKTFIRHVGNIQNQPATYCTGNRMTDTQESEQYYFIIHYKIHNIILYFSWKNVLT